MGKHRLVPRGSSRATRHDGDARHPDLLVIGGGAGGLAAARAAARRGARTVLVQDGPLGGDCTFTGCVPSKALIEAAARGVSFADALTTARDAIDSVAAREDELVLRREGVTVVSGWAIFKGPGHVDVGGTSLRPRRVVIATGARPATPPVPGLDQLEILTNENVFDVEERPGSLAVLGGGAVGCELAQALRRLGVAVTLIEAVDRLLPGEEPEASDVVREVLRREGVDVRTGRTVSRVEPLEAKGAGRLVLDDGATVDADRLLVAVGRTPSTEGLGLEEAGVQVDDRGAIVTDDTLATTAAGVWAVGDVVGRVQLTHAADEMGRIAVANALGRRPRRRFRPEWVPAVTFTDPEVARIGTVEREAPAGARIAHVPMTDVDRAIAAASTDGFVKLVCGPRRLLGNLAGGRLLGATVVAPRAGEMIAEAALAVRTGMFAGRLAQTVHAYPTWSTAIRQAAAQLFVEVDGRRARPAEQRRDGR